MPISDKIRLAKFVQFLYKISRNKANNLIKNNLVMVNNKIITKSCLLIKKTDKINLIKQKQYVSRGAYKLIKVSSYYKIDLDNKVCLDIGCSTGGFCQVLLETKAKLIYAIDVGKKQFNKLILTDKIILWERTNFLNLTKQDFKNKIDFITCDVSFISIKKIINHIDNLFNYHFKIICLIKPQFELNQKIISLKKGYGDFKYHQNVIAGVINFAKQLGFICHNVIKSPILGAKKQNQEYLILLEK